MKLTEKTEVPAIQLRQKLGSVRWTICALLFFSTTVNYLDRQVFSNLVPFFENDLRLGPTDLALINVSFLVAYGIGMVFVGRLIDRIGTRIGLAVAFLVWSLASIAHGLAGGLSGFLGVRFLLGLGESGNFPAAVRTVAEWFPKKERALATGWFNSGSNLGAILAPVLVVWVATAWGWRMCFVLLGATGMVWMFFWLWFYRRPGQDSRVGAAELKHIRGDLEPETEQPPSYSEIFAMRPVYAFAMAKFFSDAPWWFYLTWLPKFLVDQFHLKPLFMAYAIPVVYVAADVGAVGGGWLSGRLIKKGFPVGRARMAALLVCALAALPVSLVGLLSANSKVSVYLAVGIVALAAAAHQGWSSNLYTVVSDVLPRGAVAMTVGIMTTFGVVGAAAFQLLVGRSVQLTGGYALPFILAGVLYLTGLLAMRLILPRMEPTPAGSRRAPMSLVFASGVGVVICLAGLQAVLNWPPYADLSAYLANRRTELHADSAPVQGSDAKVGWMSARWYLWKIPGKAPKPELVKFDRDDRPIIETKGDQASHYQGPKTGQFLRTSP